MRQVKTIGLYLSGHLVIEKLLKAIYVKAHEKQPHVPKIHNLLLLAEKSDLVLNEKQAKMLSDFNTFNISGRYEDVKNSFREKCTRRIYERANC